uniref:Reverse transcriptase/retrotransposon-derived protein RNase H-like domain-containing protein n=1 Tax=Nothoprocta perdicaria TaxID=30464 RepID=A0A8C6YIW6_NOTPE
MRPFISHNLDALEVKETQALLEWIWTREKKEAFEALKQALLEASALALPDLSKEFHLFIDEKKGTAKGVLTQNKGAWKRVVGYLSKKLDPVVVGWPPCLRIIAAAALMTKDVDKLTFGQQL